MSRGDAARSIGEMACIAVVGWIVAVAGCAATLPPVPGKGGPPWFELTSEHFTLWTDAAPGRAHELIEEMERLHQVIIGVAFPTASSGRILVIATRDDDELRVARPERDARAFAIGANAPLFQPAVFVSAFSNHRDTDVVLTHELSHAISFGVFPRQPRWFSEGLADYFETLNIDIGNTAVDVGVAPRNRGRPERKAQLVPISTLLAWPEWPEPSPPRLEAQLYSTAWALFTFLINEHRTELMRYIEVLNAPGVTAQAGELSPAVSAWLPAFPSLPLDRVDEELRRWLVSGKHVVLHFRLQVRPSPCTERKLSDAEAHAIQGFLIDDATQEHQHLRAALALDPTNVLARLLELVHRKAIPSVAEATAITAAHPEDWRAWWLEVLARHVVRTDDPAIASAAGRACTLIAQNPAVRAPPGLCTAEGAQASSP